MKEKRVDVHIAMAGFWQLLVIAFGGTALTELFKTDGVSIIILIGSLTSMLVCATVTFYHYRKALLLSKKSKS